MPELPEVETILQGIKPIVEKQSIANVVVRQQQLRWKIPSNLANKIKNCRVIKLTRRGKYILWHLSDGASLILHFGMSGFLRVIQDAYPAEKHDHVDIVLRNGNCIRYNDTRRFGALLYTRDDVYQHPLLKNLGLEPLTAQFNGDYLHHLARTKKLSVKQFIMDHHVVVGVGNIYATEALFLSGIHPLCKVSALSSAQFKTLANNIKAILRTAIKKGGTTFKDFQDSSGKPGYFAQQLKVYGRDGLNCSVCSQSLESLRIAQRATVFCPRCQVLDVI